jgi:hypothetical protein
MDVKVVIGHWVEKEPRKLSRCPGYYAADWEEHVTKPGRYPLVLVFVAGYTCPMPYWLLTGIDSEIVDGQTYSGFGGVNHASQAAAKGPSQYAVQTYDYLLPDMVKAGHVELLPGMEWALDRAAAMALTWDRVQEMSKAAGAEARS